MKLTFFGQSAFQIETSDHTLLFDPFLSGNEKCSTDPASLKPDYILLTHGHGDHWGDTEQIAKASGATVISNFEIAQFCESKGLKAHPMHIGGAFNFPFGRVKLTMAQHGSSLPGDDGLPIYLGNPAGILVEIEGKTIFHAGDTGLFMDMQLIGELNDIELAILPIGDNFTMGPEDALRAAEYLKPNQVIPCHYDTFPLIEVSKERMIDFENGLLELGIKAHIISPGTTLEI